jgi:hypothetical protein
MTRNNSQPAEEQTKNNKNKIHTIWLDASVYGVVAINFYPAYPTGRVS